MIMVDGLEREFPSRIIFHKFFCPEFEKNSGLFYLVNIIGSDPYYVNLYVLTKELDFSKLFGPFVNLS